MKVSIRLFYAALVIAGATYLHGRQADFVQVVLFMAVGAVGYELLVAAYARKIVRWPDDLALAKKKLEVLSAEGMAEDIMSIEFGRISESLEKKLRSCLTGDLVMERIYDPPLSHANVYLEEKIKALLQIISVEMFAPDQVGQTGRVLPREWVYGGPSNSQYARYRDAQRSLRTASRELIVAIKAFADCLHGASKRV